MFAALAFVVWCLRARSVKAGLFNTAPALGGMGVALIFHMLCGRSGGTGNEVSLDIPQVLRVLVQQMAASIPGLNSRICRRIAAYSPTATGCGRWCWACWPDCCFSSPCRAKN